MAGIANNEGRVAGSNAAGIDARLRGALGTGVLRVHPYMVGVTGLTERVARQDGRPYRVMHTLRAHHAGYYPGARDVLLKLLYEPDTGRILGAQAVGEEGVDKRIDVIATAIHGRLTIDDLAELDLAYAPQVGAAKDPVVITGMGATNLHRGPLRSISAEALAAWLDGPKPPLLLDVRDLREVAREGAIPGAHHIPLNEIRDRLHEIPAVGPIVVYCRSGHRSYVAGRILRQHGRTPLYNLSGGATLWGLVGPVGDVART